MRLKLSILISILVFGFAFSQSKEVLVVVENINKYSKVIDKDPKVIEYKFEVKGKDKTILYQYSKKGNEIVKISREWKRDSNDWWELYRDYFLLKNGERIFAIQSITYTNMSDAKDIIGWSSTFWIDKKVIHMVSLGHGKSEMDDWDYELELKDNFNYMLKTAKEFDKNRLAKIK
ncbi:hypothetical protein [Epilithonimonas lactis]|uniref:Uncharacterized protein n=1 Tax=Epilithonimonas lactis TaxID=421072 RepID=A0A085BMX1_9FLAO|nr:hypothetical protein [Epilithonimonas lactis]KFC23816.1 hypothetical protein IO89_04400 [Epilithonimonas lactis]SEQ26275.1 hypothetical protein SAMN04488097_1853 [Epilithonimonas lactis]